MSAVSRRKLASVLTSIASPIDASTISVMKDSSKPTIPVTTPVITSASKPHKPVDKSVDKPDNPEESVTPRHPHPSVELGYLGIYVQ